LNSIAGFKNRAISSLKILEQAGISTCAYWTYKFINSHELRCIINVDIEIPAFYLQILQRMNSCQWEEQEWMRPRCTQYDVCPSGSVCVPTHSLLCTPLLTQPLFWQCDWSTEMQHWVPMAVVSWPLCLCPCLSLLLVCLQRAWSCYHLINLLVNCGYCHSS